MSLLDLSRIFKAYDVRGIYPDDINETVAKRLGAAFAAFVKAPKVIVGRDMRLSSPALAAAFIQGVTEKGTWVIDVGGVCIVARYLSSGERDALGHSLHVTSSHY